MNPISDVHHPRSIIASAVDKLLPSGYSYSSPASSYRGLTFTWSSTLMVIPFFALYIYPWLTAGPAAASEIRGRSAVRYNVPAGCISLNSGHWFTVRHIYRTLRNGDGAINYFALVGIAAVTMVIRGSIKLGPGTKATLIALGALQFAVFLYLDYEFLS